MQIRQLSDRISVAPQIEPADLSRLAEAGFTTVIDNRPDVEIGVPLGSEVFADAARAAGLDFHYLPIVPGQMTADLVQDFAAVLDGAPGPVLAYCRSGTRSAHAWALGQAGRMSAEEIIAAGARAGYDLSGLGPYLR